MKLKLSIVLVVVASVLIAGLILARGRGPEARILDHAGGKDWAAYGRTYGEQHYSPLIQVNAQWASWVWPGPWTCRRRTR